MPALVIYTPKKKLIRLAIVSAAFVATCIWMLVFPTEEVEALEKVAAYLGIPFFGLVGLFSLSRLLWPKPAVVVDESGFLDNATPVGVGFIPWSEICDVCISSDRKQSSLAIYVVDPEKYLRRANPLTRALLRLTQSSMGTAIVVPLSDLPVSGEKLLSVIRMRLHAREVGR